MQAKHLWHIALLGAGIFNGVHAAADYRGEVTVNYLRGSVDVGGGYTIPDYTPPPTTGPVDPPVTGGPVDPPVEPPIVSPTEASDDDYDGWSVAGTLYLQPVDTSRGPWRLAPFLSRASSVGGSYGRLETDRSDVETEFWNVFTRLVVGENWVVEADFGSADADADVANAEVDVYSAAVAYYVAQTTQIRAGYTREDEQQADADHWHIDVEHVAQLENGMTFQGNVLFGWVSGDHDVFGSNDGTDIAVEISWFFNDAFGIGADYLRENRDDGGDADAHNIWASYYPTDKISLELSYYKEEQDGFDVESDGVEFTARYRF